MMNNPQEIASTFNSRFLTVGDTVIGNTKKGNSDPRVNMDHSIYLINNFNSTFPRINWFEIDKIIKSLKTKNSYRYDEITIKILKLSAPLIIYLLTDICNKFLSSGVFPKRLKYAIVRPVYKKGDKLLTTNYGAISLFFNALF
jgi:hypothetical protein